MKYITYINFDSITCCVIFDKCTDHIAMSKGLMYRNILGAGFVSFGDDGTIHCYGESISLNIKSNDKDASIIEKCRTDY